MHRAILADGTYPWNKVRDPTYSSIVVPSWSATAEQLRLATFVKYWYQGTRDDNASLRGSYVVLRRYLNGNIDCSFSFKVTKPFTRVPPKKRFSRLLWHWWRPGATVLSFSLSPNPKFKALDVTSIDKKSPASNATLITEEKVKKRKNRSYIDRNKYSNSSTTFLVRSRTS